MKYQNNNSKEYTIELVKKLDCTEKNNTLFSKINKHFMRRY